MPSSAIDKCRLPKMQFFHFRKARNSTSFTPGSGIYPAFGSLSSKDPAVHRPVGFHLWNLLMFDVWLIEMLLVSLLECLTGYDTYNP
jgi:hypothetical protein